MNIISTVQLLQVVSDNSKQFIQARLLLGNYTATHFLLSKGKYLYDEGIDGEQRKTNFSDFSNRYLNCFWVIDQIV